VLETSGRCAHAEGAAEPGEAREALRQAVLASERARGSMRRTDPDDALELWKALVAGRWSLVEHFDTDGHRYLVARKNDPALDDPRGLSLRERQVVAYAALGHPSKLISYELGLAPATVSKHLTSAMRKLQVRTHAELMLAVSVTPQVSG
jgi:DNA-binding NarL/FixJ family response regulator